ncbi:MAG: hypothetical protein JO302_00405 [Candidatus Eremiobacteraeota bacterium]|nr:hypothetical protein [Candidatus Eremiobacteraeota bacterium]
MKRSLQIAAFAAASLVFASLTAPAKSATNAGNVVALPYVAAFTPAFGPSGVPYAGTMNLVMHDGTISGTYSGISVRPDRLNDRISSVNGTMSSDGAVQFQIGNALSFTGELENDGTISGTANYEGRLFDFLAKPGSPGRLGR